MSARAHRRRAKPSVKVKQAFEDDENEDDLVSSGSIDFDRFHERAFFTINDSTVEVILNKNLLSWDIVSDEICREDIHQRKTNNRESMTSINLQNVYAISPLYNRWNWMLNNNSNQSSMSLLPDEPLQGFQLHSYDRMDDNILQEILIIFQSTSPNQIERWYRLLSKIISEYKPSRNVLVLCNPYSGPRDSRYVYNVKIRPMFERAQYNITYLEINDLCSAEEVLNDFQGDFDSLYGLVIIGGDGSVINVINALLRYLEKENRTRLDIENDLPPLPFPICIVPNGTTNIICHSIHGNKDHCTPILHLLFNHWMKIDMSAVFDDNYNFITANFSAGAGYPANALRYFTRYSSFSPKKIIQKSFTKAALNKNLRPIEVEIRYIPANQTNNPITRCHQGCSSCTPTVIEETDNRVKMFNDTHIQKISKRKKSLPSNKGNNHRLLSSSRRNSNKQNEEEKNWKILRQNYLQVAVLTNANLWSFAPQGLSKFGHLADGLLDLIIIEPTTRKEFLRSVKRHANSKNQYEFPFTNLIKVKEIEIELILPNRTLNPDTQCDSSQSDEEQSDHKNNSSVKPRPPKIPVSENSRRHHYSNERLQESSKSIDTTLLDYQNQPQKYSESEFDSLNASFRRKNFFHSLKLKKDKTLPRPSSELANEKQNRQSASRTLRPAKSFLNLLTRGNSSSDMKQDSSTLMNNNANGRRLSSIENGKIKTSVNNQYRNKKQVCMWNLDFTPYNSPLIRVKCFQRFLPVFGVGLNPDTLIKEVNYSCFGPIG